MNAIAHPLLLSAGLLSLLVAPNLNAGSPVSPAQAPAATTCLAATPKLRPATRSAPLAVGQVLVVPQSSLSPHWWAVLERKHLAPTSSLVPGVYQSFPYSCLVLVPPTGLDDKFIIGGGKGPVIAPDRMPEFKPELRLIPRKLFARAEGLTTVQPFALPAPSLQPKPKR